MSEFRFADAQWAHLFWGLLAIVALLFWLERRRGDALQQLLSATLQDRLVSRPGVWRTRARILLVAASGACLILALMRPQWGLRYVETPRAGAEIMICLDVSRSMLAEDVTPNRLERAKAELADLLPYLREDQVGLIAFAGRATVLSPLTSDFGFLRLVLDSVNLRSVTRGGTNLAAPIRLATAGFGPASEAARVILLVTDGEDHDSFPLDAAREAAEAGVTVIAIGFGDEAGSRISLTEPRTGARELLRDADGEPVISRLDGETLREIALTTDGAYVPAGTGVLDLESIYERRIAGLTRGQLRGRGRALREEGYQWALLLALVSLIGSALAGGGRIADRQGFTAGARAASLAAAVMLALAPGMRAWGQSVPPSGPAKEAPTAIPEATPDETPEPTNPREIYNDGLAELERGQRDEADALLRRSRRRAAADGELRFRATYNLGWSRAQRAEAELAEAPGKALRLLYEAADWFREAVRLQPQDMDSRKNLEVTLRRALLVADKIAQESPSDLSQKIGELAERQRDLAGKVVETLAGERATPEAGEDPTLRRAYRALAADQRSVLADGDQLASQIAEERDAIDERPEAERPPEDQMRATQLTNVLHYVHRARARMGQARRQLRQRQGERAYRRTSAALAELKRALDQLRDPVAVLDRILSDAVQLATQTRSFDAGRRQLSPDGASAGVPGWLTSKYLVENQTSVAESTAELDRRLLSGLEQSPPAGTDPASQNLLRQIAEAEPFVGAAQHAFDQAAQTLQEARLEETLDWQRDALKALLEARERFLELRGLIEVIYADERQIDSFLGSELAGDKSAAEEALPDLRATQSRELERAERLKGMLADEKLSGANAEGAEQDAAAAVQRLELAEQILELARTEMDSSSELLGESGTRSSKVDWAGAHDATTRAVEHLGMLRRLFFSIAEHIRETADEQLDLADETRDAAALMDGTGPAAAEQLGPLAPRQHGLAQRAEQIAEALEEQSRQEGGALSAESESEESTRRLRQAAELVLAAQGDMSAAATHLEGPPAEPKAAGERQLAALGSLRDAIALLVPPEQRNQEGSQDSGQDESPGAAEQAEAKRSDGEQLDPAQLLQAVRDREAQRRQRREHARAGGYETVEKDW